jgi:hypothetical protein
MLQISIDVQFLVYVLAGVTALVFDWFPGVKSWYELFTEAQKKVIMAGMLAVIVVAIYGLGCVGFIAGLTCDKLQASALLNLYLIAIGINQGAHQLFKPAKPLTETL